MLSIRDKIRIKLYFLTINRQAQTTNWLKASTRYIHLHDVNASTSETRMRAVSQGDPYIS